MTVASRPVASSDVTMIDGAALGEALDQAAARFGRLSNEQVRSLRQRRRTIAAMAVTGPALCVLLFVGVGHFAAAPTAPAHWTRVVATRPGERGTATLADGSTIKLNGATRVRLDYTAGQRTAHLTAGQAFFDVRHDATRPFIVRAGQGEMRVLGTAFDIDLTRKQVAVSVYRGAVGFDAADSPRGVVVRAGYRSTLRGGTVEAPARFDPALPGWRQGWIDTAGIRLDDLVDVLGRQGKVPIVRPEGALASITISGRFRTDRPRELLSAIGDGYGFVVEEKRDGLTLRAAR